MKRPSLSLRARAVAWLAQREHSEVELRRKLQQQLQAEARATKPAFGETGPSAEALAQHEQQHHQTKAPAAEPCACAPSDAERVNEVIAWLRERGYLDEHRFVASRVHARSGRVGLVRIQQELSRHGLVMPQETAQTLRSTELERATAVWQRKFGQLADNAREAARQARFLVGRGFSGEVVRKVLRAAAGAGQGDHDSI